MNFDVNILASCDVHGFYMPWDYSVDRKCLHGSLTQISTVVEKLRGQYPETILLDVGDMFQGNCSEIFILDQKHPAVEAMNHIGYDIWQMGNHEYGCGLENLSRFTESFNGSVLSANVYNFGKRIHLPYKIIEKGPVKIAFIGLVTTLINQFEKSIYPMNGVWAKDMKDELRAVEAELSGKVDAMVAVVHAGVENENMISNTGVRDLLKGDKYLDAVFCGHLHQMVNTKIDDIVVLEGGKDARALCQAVFHFEIDENKKRLKNISTRLININEDVKSDESLEKILLPFHRKALEFCNEEVGTISSLEYDIENEIRGIPQFRLEETFISDFFLDVVRYYGRADVSMIQIDNDDVDLKQGKIKRKDINRNFTYVSGGITSYRIHGSALKKIALYCASYYNRSFVGDVNISFDPERASTKYSSNFFLGNLKFVIDLCSDERVKNLCFADGKKVQDNDVLIFATTKYTMDKLISLGILEQEKIDRIYSTKEQMHEMGSIRNLALRYIKEVLNGVVSVQKRSFWKIEKAFCDPYLRKCAIYLINNGYIDLINTRDKRGKNVRSINVYDVVDENDLKLESLGLDIKSFENKAHLYKTAYEIIRSRKL